MTDQTPESTDPRPDEETLAATDAELNTEPEIVEAEVVEPDLAEAEVAPAGVAGLDLGTDEAPAPIGTDFDVVTEPTKADPAPEPAPQAPAPPTGGSFLDLPPLPDLNYPAPTPPPASPYPPPAASYPRAASYPPAEQPHAPYAPYPSDYSAQAAGQAYGHGTPAPVPQPQPQAVRPYGTPTGFAVQPYQQAASADTTMASLAHWGALVADVVSGTSLGFLVPLVIMLTKGKDDPFVRANAVESLNFNLTVILGMIVSALLLFIFVGIIGLIVIPIVALILQILGAIAANRGEVYRYPVSIRFVK